MFVTLLTTSLMLKRAQRAVCRWICWHTVAGWLAGTWRSATVCAAASPAAWHESSSRSSGRSPSPSCRPGPVYHTELPPLCTIMSPWASLSQWASTAVYIHSCHPGQSSISNESTSPCPPRILPPETLLTSLPAPRRPPSAAATRAARTNWKLLWRHFR